MSRRGFRWFGGKEFLLFEAGNYFGSDAEDEQLERTAAVAREYWRRVRIVRDMRRYRYSVWVFDGPWPRTTKP